MSNQVLDPVAAGAVCHNTEAAEEQLIRKPKQSPKSPTWNMVDDRESEAREMKTIFQDSLSQAMEQNKGDDIAFKEHSEHMNKLAFLTKECDAHDDAAPSRVPDCSDPSVVDQVSNLASVLSRVMPKQMKRMDAEQLRVQWEELIDALEKERLELPKIKTGGLKSGVMTRTNSPRDSGCVKRIAEQMKSSRATKLDEVGKSQKEKDIALEDAAMRKGRLYWTKVEQKEEVVF
ncbi:hypothetical protein M758_3G225200 [Ceratodon purpureus]|nr:hypothetical protein M758_3G225200 [Ceratodon purpureus]